jgi:hypothetical protein
MSPKVRRALATFVVGAAASALAKKLTGGRASPILVFVVVSAAHEAFDAPLAGLLENIGL